MAELSTWIFDLDNTLYPASCRLFDQVEQRIGLYIEQLLGIDSTAAKTLQKQYFRDHKTTLNGLIVNHRIDPHDFLEFVHRIDHSRVSPDPRLDRVLALLPGRKFVFTNGSVDHAAKVMGRLGIQRHFSDVFDIAAAGFTPKPEPAPYLDLLKRHAIEATQAVMIDDMPRNLAPAAALGMTTVWVRTDIEWAQRPDEADYIHHVTDDLSAWLEAQAIAEPRTRTGINA